MKASEILAALKEKFNALIAPAPAQSPAPAPVALTEYTLQDGITQISVSDLNPGGTVSIKDGTGAETPAPAGDLVLQDGTVINVAEGGVIAAVTAPAPAAPPAPAMPAGMSAEQVEKFEEMAAKVAGYETIINEFKQEFTAYKENSEKVTGDLLQLVELLVQEPSGEPDPSATRGSGLKKPEPTKEQFAKALFSKK